MHPDVYSIINISQIMEESICPLTDEWIYKVWYTYNGILAIKKKKRNFAICNNMDDLEYIMLR